MESVSAEALRNAKRTVVHSMLSDHNIAADVLIIDGGFYCIRAESLTTSERVERAIQDVQGGVDERT